MPTRRHPPDAPPQTVRTGLHRPPLRAGKRPPVARPSRLTARVSAVRSPRRARTPTSRLSRSVNDLAVIFGLTSGPPPLLQNSTQVARTVGDVVPPTSRHSLPRGVVFTDRPTVPAGGQRPRWRHSRQEARVNAVQPLRRGRARGGFLQAPLRARGVPRPPWRGGRPPVAPSSHPRSRRTATRWRSPAVLGPGGQPSAVFRPPRRVDRHTAAWPVPGVRLPLAQARGGPAGAVASCGSPRASAGDFCGIREDVAGIFVGYR
jgi:hypothetical protein